MMQIKTSKFKQDSIIPDQITSNIYLGDYQSSLNRQFLNSHNIRNIVFCIKNKPAPFPNELNYCRIPINDFVQTNIRVFFEQAYKFIEDVIVNDQKVLIHCIAGKSRSAAILTSYLMKKLNIGYKQALTMIKEKRSIAQPNQGFMNQLKAYQNQLKQEKL